jgi:hypothetical protein
VWHNLKAIFFSVFAGCPIPYPKREFLTDDDQDDKDKRQQATNVCFFNDIYNIKNCVCVCFYQSLVTTNIFILKIYINYIYVLYFFNSKSITIFNIWKSKIV